MNWTTTRQMTAAGSWLRRTLTTDAGVAHIDKTYGMPDAGEFNFVLTVEGTDRVNLFVTLAEAKEHAAYVLAR